MSAARNRQDDRRSGDLFAGLVHVASSAAAENTDRSSRNHPNLMPDQSPRMLRRSESVQTYSNIQRTAETENDRYGSKSGTLRSSDDHADQAFQLGDRGNRRSGGLLKRKKASQNLREVRVSPSQGHEPRDIHSVQEEPPVECLSGTPSASKRPTAVHSAAALFRQPSTTSQRYTRPPMSKVFSSLELAPENFLSLQAEAKAYMLDEHHPERRACVGHRGSGDIDVVKLKLYTCVKEFLEGEERGRRFFSHEALQDGVPRQNLVWPDQKQEVIAAVTPLLRRMVTNERQRQYALQTRRTGGRKRKSEDLDSAVFSWDGDRQSLDENMSITTPRSRRGSSVVPGSHVSVDPQIIDDTVPQPLSKRQRMTSPESQPIRSPKVSYSHQPPPQEGGEVRSAPDSSQFMEVGDGVTQKAPNDVTLQINVLRNDCRVLPRIDIPFNLLDSRNRIEQDLTRFIPDLKSLDGSSPDYTFEALVHTGLIPINNYAALMRAIRDVQSHDWMDMQLKILAHVT